MDIVEYKEGQIRRQAAQKLKHCVFCDELIGANAVKCRMCGEFLNTEKAKKLLQAAERKAQGLEAETQEDTGILFAAKPSLFGLAGAAVKTLIFIALAFFVFKYPVENLIDRIYYKVNQFQMSDGQYFAISYWRQIVAVGLMVMFVLLFALKVLKLKMTHYEVNSDRIEYSRGILDRRVDNLDMFRVVDLKLRRTILDCMFGIGQVTLITSDKSDPEFTFEKVRNSRGLYDVIKKASLEADQSQRVVHME
ncbi:MAG: PH domain-containing protein [Phycisphaerae bacterium]|jgi:membrane protein YdbS with pleckstrin-like domain